MRINKKIKRNSGFTLIELLVVIAIIGILSGIVIVALNGAREKAKVASIKAEMSQMRAAAELYALDHDNEYNDQAKRGNNGDGCLSIPAMFGDEDTAGPYVKSIKETLVGEVGALPQPGTTIGCTADKKAWAFYVRKDDWDFKWCVDSDGYTGTTVVSPWHENGVCNQPD